MSFTVRYPKTRDALSEVGIDPTLVPEVGLHEDHYEVFGINDDGKRIFDREARESKIDLVPWPSTEVRDHILAVYKSEGGRW